MSRYTKPGLTLSPTEGGTGISLDTADNGTLLIGDGAGGFTPNPLTAGSGVTITNGPGTILISATGSGGSVISVGLTAPGEFSISGSPVTLSGNLGLSWANQSGNVVLASPSGGGSGVPGFRSLVAADIPNLDTAKITTGTLNLARLSGITTSQLSSTAGIVAGQIASVNPSVLTGSGTVPLAGLTGITTSQLSATAGITSGQIASIPNQNASIITTGTLGTARGGTGLDTSGATNGKLLIGTGSGLALANLSAGSNITITNASGGITIASTGGSSSFSWATKTTTYTITTSDSGILADATSASFTVTLPTAVGATQSYTVKKKDSTTNTITVATTSSQTIDGISTYIISTPYLSLTFGSDNANWFIL